MTKLPRLTSSTRLVLIGLCLTLCVLSIYTVVTSNSLAEQILEIFKAVIYTVTGFFFGQRDQEHKTFAKNNINESRVAEVVVGSVGSTEEIPQIHDAESLDLIG